MGANQAATDARVATSAPETEPPVAAGAVEWVREHLGTDAEAWERVAFTFNQKQQLPALAPHVPTARPRLGRQAYAMVAASFVPNRTKRRGGGLLPLLQGWPHSILSDVADEVSLIITRHLQTCPPGAMADMQRALAELYSVQARPPCRSPHMHPPLYSPSPDVP